MAPVVRVTRHSYKVACQRASSTSGHGCGPTGCNSTRQKSSFCGVRRWIDCSRFKMLRQDWSLGHARMTTYVTPLYIWLALTTCTGAHHVSVRGTSTCTVVSRTCAIEPCWWTSTCGWQRVTASAAICIANGCFHYYPSANWWPCLSRCRCVSVEQPSTAGDVIIVADNISAALKNWTVYSVVRVWTFSFFLFCVLMSRFILFYSVCALKVLLVINTTLYKLSFIIIIITIIMTNDILNQTPDGALIYSNN